MALIFTLIFFVSLIIVIGIIYYQWKKVMRGEVEIKNIQTRTDDIEPAITLRDIGILFLYILKHLIQFIIIQASRLYFIISKKLKNFKNHKNPKIARVVQRLKVPPVPPAVKSFVNKTINETKQKINRVKQDLAELEETIDKRVD